MFVSIVFSLTRSKIVLMYNMNTFWYLINPKVKAFTLQWQ